MKKILIIEDNEDIAMLLRDVLVAAGFEVMVCYDGLQGTEFTHKIKPDLVILDLMLPAGGGLYVLQKVKLSSVTKFIPIVILTASKDPEHRKTAESFGVAAFFEKPYDAHQLIAKIKEILKISPTA